MNTRKASSFFFIFIFLFASTFAIAQQPAATDTAHSKKQIYILNAKRLNYEKKDSAEYQSAAGNVIIKQDSTLFYSDSVVINKTRNMLEAFGHVHINDADSVHTYSDYLRYIGNEKRAFLKDNVRLTDGRATLTTPELEYDVNTKIGTYIKGGKVVNGSTVLTSNEGYYYGETRDIYFKKNVLLVSPDYNVKTDTLLYNTYTDVATFIVPTEITSGKNRKILTSDGYYDLRNKKYYFGKRPQIQDSTTFLIADEVAHEDSSGFGEARGNVIYRDTAQGVTILTNNLKNNSKTNSFLATQKPVMILKQDKDSIYIAADTFYSAKLTELIKTRYVPVIDDSLAQQQQQYIQRRMLSKPSSPTELFPALADSLHQQYTDTSSSFASQLNQVAGIDSLLPAEDTSLITESSDSSVKSSQSASSQLSDSSLTSFQLSNSSSSDSSSSDSSFKSFQSSIDSSHDRFIEAYYHVRIFSDSLQAIGDSLFYSANDSAFRLFKNPIVWAQQSQVNGDTIYLYTANKKPKRVYVFENALNIEKVGDNYYNQVKGRTINGWFVDGNIDHIRARGNAESVYYAQDDNEKFVGVNKNSSDVIDIYFKNKEAHRVVFLSNLQGTAYPMRQVNHEELRLRGFTWKEELRPKTKYDLFGN